MVPLAEYSRDRLRELRAERGIAYDERSQGTLQLFRTQKHAGRHRRRHRDPQEFGVPYELLDVEGCARVEPALGLVRDKIAGGLRLPGDKTGDCSNSPVLWPRSAASKASSFVTARDRRILTDGGKVTGVATDKGTVKGDVFVVALGSYSPLLLRTVGSICRSTRSKATRSPSRLPTLRAPRNERHG